MLFAPRDLCKDARIVLQGFGVRCESFQMVIRFSFAAPNPRDRGALCYLKIAGKILLRLYIKKVDV